MTERCESGDGLLFPTRSRHVVTDVPGQPLWVYGLAVDPRSMAPFADLEPFLPNGRLPRIRAVLPDIEARFRRLLFLDASGDIPDRLAATAAALDIFVTLARTVPTTARPAGGTDPLDEYLRWLSRNFYERLTVADGADRCGLSRRTFTAKMKERTGQTWLAHVHGRRIDYAVRLLRSTDEPVTSIAFRAGFEELSTFYRAFKRHTGRKPLDYRGPESS
ncbi:MAG: AraC family transcriptional regulator [Planctomycetota bacterium]